MIATIFINVFAVSLALVASYSDNPRKSLFFSFLIVFIFLALRYDFGNDYMPYFDYFTQTHRTNVDDLLRFQAYDSLGFKEFGYTWLNKLFPSFYLMVAFLSLFSCIIYYRFIISYGTQYILWFPVFLYLFDPYLMLVQSSAMRQTIAICLFIYSVKYLIERSFWKYCLLILLGSLFHKSSIVLIPVYFIITPFQWNKRILISMIGFYVIIAFFGYIFLSPIENFMSQVFPNYLETYFTDSVNNKLDSGLGFLFTNLIFLFIIWSHNKGPAPNILISKLTIIAFVLTPLGFYLNMFNRIMMYFTPFIILSLPFAVSSVKSRHLRIIIVGLLLLFYLYEFFIFFQHPTWKGNFNYKINLINVI